MIEKIKDMMEKIIHSNIIKNIIHPDTIQKINNVIYPATLIIISVFMIILFVFIKKMRRPNRAFEKFIASIIGIYQISLWGVYIAFGHWAAVLLTDISPFVFVVTFLSLLTSKATWLRKGLMPYLLLTGIVTMALSTPGFSKPYQKDSLYLTQFIDSIFTYIKHTISLIVGLYFLFTLPKYKGWEWLLPLFIPAVLIGWIFLTTGILYFITGDPRWGMRSTGVFYPAMLPFATKETITCVTLSQDEVFVKANTLNQSEYNDIIKFHPTWTKFIDAKIIFKNEPRWIIRMPLADSFWGLKTYVGGPSYAIMFKMHRILELHHFIIASIFYGINIVAAYFLTIISNIIKRPQY